MAWGHGDEAALNRMIPLVHGELQQIAWRCMGGEREALVALAKVDERKSRMIELRCFGGLSVEETATVLHVSPDTVKRDWRLAKAWLLRELRGDDGTKQDEHTQ